MKRILCACALLVLFAACHAGNASRSLPTTPSPSPVVPLPPPATFTLSGAVTAPGSGDPVPGVSVTLSAGRSTTTDAMGFYSFQNIARTKISFSKDGYESQGPFGVYPMDRDTTVNARLARTIQLVTGQVLDGTLFPDDAVYDIRGELGDDYEFENPFGCGGPCKLIRSSLPSGGRFTARVMWTGSDVEFQLWIVQKIGTGQLNAIRVRGASQITSSLQVEAGEVLVYFGLPWIDGNMQRFPAAVTFQLITSLQPPAE